MSAFPSSQFLTWRVYNETVKFHHKLELGMQDLSLQQAFSFEKMQFLYKATNKEVKLVMIIVTVPKPLGLLHIAGTLACNINQSLQKFGKEKGFVYE